MPSLQALADFKTSFRKIGNEARSLEEQNLLVDDLSLPENEPEPLAAADSAPSVPDSGNQRQGIPQEEPTGPDPGDFDSGNPPGDIDLNAAPSDTAGTESGIPGLDDFDFSDFLDTAPEDLPETNAGEENLDFPEDLLKDFASEIEAGRVQDDAGPDSSGEDPFSLAESGGEEFPESASAEPESTDIPSLEDMDFSGFDLEGESSPGDALPGLPTEEVELPEELPDLDLPGLDLSEKSEPDPFNLDLPDLVMPPEPELGLPVLEPPPDLGEAPSLPIIEELIPLPDEDEKEPGSSAGTQTTDLNEGEFSSSEDLILGDADSFDAFSLDGEAPSADLKEANIPSPEGGGKGEPGGGFEEFSLAGIDDVLNGTAPRTKTPGEPEKAGVEKAEDIRLQDEDLARLQRTLASYPLNLRIACEELIAGQTAAVDQIPKLVKLLVRGAAPKETAALAGKILGRTIDIPRGFEKKTGEALEEEQASFSYVFIRKFLPVLRLFLMIALVAVSLIYLIHQFIYTPLRANSIYRLGYERIPAGDYARANERFNQAFRIHGVKDWFYRYAEAFRDARQYIYAEEKYDELLRYYPRDKKAVLDYAAMETNYLRNYSKADTLLRRNILDYAVDDPEALLALGDNSLAWGEFEPSRYEDARASYARLLERYGWTDPVVERMMKYFIRTDNLGEVLPLQGYFMNNSRRKISPATLAELGGYLLDKRMEETQGVPSVYVERIEGIRNVLLTAVTADAALPESHYHLARYYNYFGNADDERITLETAIRAFDSAPEESVKRVQYRIDTERRYAQVLTNNREFFSAEEQLIKGIGIYEDAVSRRLLSRSQEFGRLYADLGDLEYFTQDGNLELALENYLRAEQNGWAPPEIQYRIGSAYYQQQQWVPALERFFAASAEMPLNRRLLYALGNVSYLRGNYFAAQGYYNRLLDLLETERTRFPLLRPGEQVEHSELAERLMTARNNMGVTLEALTERTGDNRYRSRALGLYTESARAWDVLTRNPDTMIRFGSADLSTPGINLAYLNSRNALYPEPDYEPQIYPHIDKDVLEPSLWEGLVPQDRLSAGLSAYR